MKELRTKSQKPKIVTKQYSPQLNTQQDVTSKLQQPAKLIQPKRNRGLIVFLIILILVLVGTIVYFIYLSLRTQNSFIAQEQEITISPTLSPTPILNLTPTPENIINPVEGKIAYVLDGEIWTINANRTENVQITNDDYIKFGISISPDKTKIAYSFYPDDPEKRTNNGLFEGYNSGIAVVDLDTRDIKFIVEYGNIQNWYPTWSPDNRYLSLWTGNGLSASVYEVASANELFSVEKPIGEEIGYYEKEFINNATSEIIWLPLQNKISYISGGNLIISHLDGSDKKILDSKAKGVNSGFESPNKPAPPIWSKSGRYVCYYKNYDLFLRDTVNNTLSKIGGSDISELSVEYSTTRVIGYNSDESKLYLTEYSNDQRNLIVLDVHSGNREVISKLFTHEVSFSPDGNKILYKKAVSSDSSKDKITIYDIITDSESTCGNFKYRDYLQTLGLPYPPDLSVWSPDNSSLMDLYSTGKVDNIRVLNLNGCETYELIRGLDISSAVWFPN